ncbi:hypothetical protein Q5P01_020059 [Channa striata]|uniref:Uncharacterized protein n=1 Tax=Channa striata TaxID=64152 RepID=A0AA88LXM5_CHASR|nr:hypothetical protein Q5P01_020059 [Channa striata]
MTFIKDCRTSCRAAGRQGHGEAGRQQKTIGLFRLSKGVPRPFLRHPADSCGFQGLCCCLTLPSFQMPSYSSSAPLGQGDARWTGEDEEEKVKGEDVIQWTLTALDKSLEGQDGKQEGGL